MTTDLQNAPAQDDLQDRRLPRWAGRLREFAHDARTRPLIPLMASLFVPGLGSLINGDVRTGSWIFAGLLMSLLLSVTVLFPVVVLGIVAMFGFWLWGLVDAYDGAVDRSPSLA